MKKRIFYILLAVVGVAMIIISVCMLTDNRQEIGVPASHCEVAFGCTPQEFFDLDLELYNEAGDFRKSAYIADDGRLMLRLTQKQIDVLEESLKQDIRIAESQHNIDVSDDYSKIIVYGYKETVYADYCEAANISYIVEMVRIMNGGNYLYEFIIKDGVTDEVVWELTSEGVDSQTIKYILDTYNFSSISDKNE